MLTPQCTVLIVDDHPLYRDALVLLLRAIVGEDNVTAATSAEEGLRVASTEPNVKLVLLDFKLPGCSGTEAIDAFRQVCSEATLIVVSASDDRRDVAAAFRLGVPAFVSKAVSTDVLADVVRRALAGQLLEAEWVSTAGTSTSFPRGLELTSRQREILPLLAQGHSNKEIGLRLNLAEITVKQHVSLIFRSLGVTNRTQAVLAARRLGL